MSVNKAILIGRLGKDPVLEYLTSGTAACKFSLATFEKFKDKAGEKQEKTEWHNIVVFGKLAEVCGEWLKKGALVYIMGKIQTRSWEKEGVKHYMTEILCNEMRMLGGKTEGTDKSSSSKPAQAPDSSTGESAPSDYDDDIPF